MEEWRREHEGYENNGNGGKEHDRGGEENEGKGNKEQRKGDKREVEEGSIKKRVEEMIEGTVSTYDYKVMCGSTNTTRT